MNSPERPLVTVVIPAYNAAAFLGQTIESAVGQTLRKIEIIVVDDGSADATFDIARQFATDDNRVRVISQANAGVAAARNHGIALGTAPYVAPLDADDIWLPDKLSRQYEALNSAAPDYGMAYCWSAPIRQGRRLFSEGPRPTYDGWVLPEIILGNFLGNGSCPMIRRSAFESVGGYDTDFFLNRAQGCEDRDLYIRIAEQYRVVLVPIVGVVYRRHSGGMSARSDRMEKSHRLLNAKLGARLMDLPANVLRWSEARYQMYLAAISLSQWRSAATVVHLLKAAVASGSLLGTRQWWLLAWRSLKRWLLPRRSEASTTEDTWQLPNELSDDDIAPPIRPPGLTRLDRLYEMHRHRARILMAPRESGGHDAG